MKNNENAIPRRNFIRNAGIAFLGINLIPSHVMGKKFGYTSPSDKLNIAGVGIGGKGRTNLLNMADENIVALCDVDWNYAGKTLTDFPNAKRFRDWRRMFDEMGNSIDAVMVATPDHTHAGVSAHSISLGKHVFTQKPLTHSVYESRLLTQLAGKYKVATQMGNQGHSLDDIRRVCEWIWDGLIGEVTEVDAWTNRPVWPQGLQRPSEVVSVPKELDWDLFIGPAPMRPYHPDYTPWNWRGWWDFGTGALGDMACHILDPAFWALHLRYPIKVEACSTVCNIESPPHAEKVVYTFPERISKNNVRLPEVKITWHDGGFIPERPDELQDGMMLGDVNGGLLFHGTKGKIMTGCYGTNPVLLPLSRMEDISLPEPYIPRVVGGDKGIRTNAHEKDWIRACKESAENRIEASAHFGYSGPLNEMVVMGVLAVRLQSLNRVLEWDGENMTFTNIPENEKLKILTRNEFRIQNGHPEFNNQYEEFNAKEMAAEWIKHSYREGWNLPAMPVD